ncbi:hypothetical protein [Xylanibacter muris]|uniref:Uncharacterized protein n=1 Tax=Xylanibacter muris TaxID=2736290 RepID=A0ABX2AL17_9BACT|nr:hypothetical protein [Xylanibacter muris]NPD90865.1 hypothetical protein [Xylanibacter muris]
MARQTNWSDDYWLMLLQLYLRKPAGLKAIYSRPLVDLGIELHIHPQILHSKMRVIANLETPRVERIWNTYVNNPKRLSRAIRMLREMNGFGMAEEFYCGVDVNETFEKDFRHVEGDDNVTPVMLIIILDLYFRLTPITMVPETPEIKELSKLIGISATRVTEIMRIFRHCDPYITHKDSISDPLSYPCHEVWQRYGNGSIESLTEYAQELKEYFRN